MGKLHKTYEIAELVQLVKMDKIAVRATLETNAQTYWITSTGWNDQIKCCNLHKVHKLAELFQLIKMAKTSWYVLAGQNPHLRQLG